MEKSSLNAAYCAQEFRYNPPPLRLPTTLGIFYFFLTGESTAVQRGYAVFPGAHSQYGGEQRFRTQIPLRDPVLPRFLSLKGHRVPGQQFGAGKRAAQN